MILFADYNTPYLFAISFVLLIGLLEIFALICGHMLSGALDAHLDHYDSITTGHISQALHYLILEDCQLSSFSAYWLVFWSYWHPVAACLHHGLAITTVEPVRGSCQFTVYDYCGALYR
ncbi:membrane protein YqiJ [Escherichia coli]|uniref:Membrane protein YqiJ n=1 Tax=Escherichia coli TaxID=562 RepID=A0A377C3F2_ECOLX|nr:membrane protein YqiJ [Escherichia coli]